ncbi:MAG: tetratricopeptide repeat protein, partial [Fidelibacterota bacterium]
IVFTDIAGYTALAAKDQHKALRLINQQREILKPIVEEFGGSWLKEIGDGLLLTFTTVSSAVDCAIKIQEKTRDTENLNLRIGIHQGEILEEGGDVFGDGVNVASRIEPFAAVGGVAISHKVQSDIAGSPEYTTKYVGKPKLKGVHQEVKVYCIISHDLPATKLSQVSAKLEKGPIALLKWAILPAALVMGFIYLAVLRPEQVPSIGILHMEHPGSQEDEFWARGITEDLIVKVASAGDIRVAPMKEILGFVRSDLSAREIAQKLRVQYLLMSSINREDNTLNLTAQVIKARSGNTIYANKWTEPMEKASTVTGTLAGTVLQLLDVATKKDISRPPTDFVEPYEFYLKGKYRWEKRRNQEDIEIAQALLRRAVQLDPSFLMAKLQLGRTFRELADYETALRIFRECQRLSEKTGDSESELVSLIKLGNTFLAKGDYREALEYYGLALPITRELGDRFSEESVLRNLGSIYYSTDDIEQALKFYNESLRIAEELGDRRGQGEGYYTLGTIYRENDLDRALASYRLSLEVFQELGEKNKELYPLLGMGLVHIEKGNTDEASTFIEKSLQMAREVGDKRIEVYSLIYAGDVLSEMMQIDRATEYYERALERAKTIDSSHLVALAYEGLGVAFLETGSYSRSSESLRSACEIWEELEDPLDHARSLSWWAVSKYESGDAEGALMKATEAGQIGSEAEFSVEELIPVHWNLYRVYSGLGRKNEANTHIERAHAGVVFLAERFQDPGERKVFLENVRMNRSIMSAYGETGLRHN